MNDLEIAGELVLMLIFLVGFPISFALSPGIIAYLKIKNRTPENLGRAKRVIMISLLCILSSLGFLTYQFFFGPDETGTPGFVLALIGYMIILIPMVVTTPMAVNAYRLSKSEV